MNILKETTEPQFLDFTPEFTGVNYIYITDEQTKEVQQIYVEPETVSYFKRVNTTFNLKENHFYSYVCIRIPDVMDFKERVLADNGIFESLDCLVNLYNELNGDYLEIVYKGRIFCTNQEIDSFNI